MKALKFIPLAAVAVMLPLAACQNAPGADGRYAHGYGYLYRAGGTRWAP